MTSLDECDRLRVLSGVQVSPGTFLMKEPASENAKDLVAMFSDAKIADIPSFECALKRAKAGDTRGVLNDHLP